MDPSSNLLWALSVLTIIFKVKGYADGNLQASCESMLVIHDDFEPSPPPMEFKVEPVIAGPDLITVTLRSKDKPFKGFMLEARNKVDRTIVGKFIILDPTHTRLLNCNGLSGSAVSHKDNLEKVLVRVNWTSEAKDLDVFFRATFVQEHKIFWNPIDFDVFMPTPAPSTTPGTSNPTTQTTKFSTTQHSAVSTMISAKTESLSASTISTPGPRNPKMHIEKYSTVMTSDVFVVSPVLITASSITNNAINHICRKWMRRCGGMSALALELSALIVHIIFDDPVNLTLIALGIVMSVTGTITLVLAFCDTGRSHELWALYDNVMDALFLIQQTFAIAFIYCSTRHCQRWLLNVLISFTAWIFLQTAYVVIVKVLKMTGSENKKGIDQMQKSHKFVAAVLTCSSVPNVGFCVAIIVGICQCYHLLPMS